MSCDGVLGSVRVLVAHGDRATRTAARALLEVVGAEVRAAHRTRMLLGLATRREASPGGV